MSPRRLFALVLVSCIAQSRQAAAATASYQLFGTVTQVIGPNTAGLAAVGVKKNAAVTIEWTEELTTPLHSTDPVKHVADYWATTPDNGITAFTVTIGSWTATAANAPDPNDPTENMIAVADGFEGGPMDQLDLSHTATDTGNLVTDSNPIGSQIVLDLVAKRGGGSTGLALGDQTPSQYPDSSGEVIGPGATVEFKIPGPDPTAKCRAAQIAAAGTLCQSALGCLAAYAKAPNKDPMLVNLQTCESKARDRFVAAFDKQTAAAASHGLSCGTSEDGATFDGHFDTAETAVVDLVDSVQPQAPTVIAPLLSGAGSMCSTGAKAESNNVLKPSSKVDLLRENARIKLTNAANKLIAKAEAKGITFDPAPDVAGIVSSIDALIDDIVTEVNGP
jgi:hypothetical protein